MLTETPRVAGPFVATGAALVCPFTFRAFSAAEVEVVSRDSEGDIEELTLDVDYTLTLNSDQSNNPGGTVTLTLAAGRLIYILGATTLAQNMALSNQGGLWPQTMEAVLDRVVAMIQETNARLDRALITPIGGTPEEALPDAPAPAPAPTPTPTPPPPPPPPPAVTVLVAPLFAPAGTVLKEGVPVQRVSGTYVNGVAVSGRRTRGSGGSAVAVANGTSAIYTPVSADVGSLMVFLETVRNSITGEEVEFASVPMGPVLAADDTGAETELLNFATGTPSGVSVVRSGATATARTGAATIATFAADTLRYQYDAAGTQLGLLCEKAATNLFPDARDMGSVMNITGAGVTVTSNYGTAPNGQTESTRVQVTVGNNGGVLLGILGVETRRRIFLCLKGSAGQLIVISNENTGEYDFYTTTGSWQILELDGTEALTSGYYGFRVLNSDGAAADFEIWGGGVQLNNGTYETLVASDGTDDERPAEVVTVTFAATSVTRDIQVTDHLNNTQNFLGETIDGSGNWSLDADELSTPSPIIKSIGAYAPGTIGSAPPPVGLDFEETAVVGDSLIKGNAPTYYSWVSPLKTLLENGGHSVTFVGTNGYLSSPGDVPVAGNGGWTVEDAEADLLNLIAEDPKTIVVALGTNDMATTYQTLPGYLDDIVDGLGGNLAGRRMIVVNPYTLSWFDEQDAELVRDAIVLWCSQGTGRTFADLNDAGLDPATDILPGPDGTHRTEAGAAKEAAYMKTVFDRATVGTGTAPTGLADLIVDRMSGESDLVPVGISGAWARGGQVTMGRGFHGTATPSWWSGGNTADYKNVSWPRFQGWWYINVTEDSKRVNNGRIEVWACQNFVQLNSTGEWILLGETDDPGAEYYPSNGSGAPIGATAWRAGPYGRQFKFDPDPGNVNIHGYGVNTNVGAYLGNIRNIAVSCWMRLVLDDPGGADDLDDMLLLADVGADAYPSGASVADFGVGYNPGVASCRFMLIERTPKLFIMSPIDSSLEIATSPMSAADKTCLETLMRASPPPVTMF